MAREKVIGWSDFYRIGLSEMDEEHRGVMTDFGALVSKLRSGVNGEQLYESANSLFEKIKRHMQHEEEMLAAYQYPGLTKQAKDHATLLRSFEQLVMMLSRGQAVSEQQILVFANDMHLHLIGADRAYGEFLIHRGAR